MTDGKSEYRAGVAFALAAFLSWGFVPAYFKQLSDVPAVEVLAHRIVWSVLFLAAYIALRDSFAATRETLRDRRLLGGLALSGMLVAVNWLIFVWAVANDHILATSLGYFINPLMNVVLGMCFLGERLRPLQWAAVGLAAAGTLYLALDFGRAPWVALMLAISFGLYGLIRKRLPVKPVQGLFVETLLMLPVALAYLVWLGPGTFSAFGAATDWWLLGTGLVTAVPLLWFVNAAKRMPYSTLGFFQYLAPSMSFLLAVFVYGEAFTQAYAVAFGSIWLGLLLFSADAVSWHRRVGAPEA